MTFEDYEGEYEGDHDGFGAVFRYTDSVNPTRSSWIPEIYYNEAERELLVNIEPEDSSVDQFWLYQNVPLEVFEMFAAADSKGTYYNQYIKRSYGPGTVLGNYEDVLCVKEEEKAEPVLASGGLFQHDGVPVVGGPFTASSSSNYVTLRFDEPKREPVGTPKGLVDNREKNYISLHVGDPADTKQRFVVSFEANGKIVSTEASAEDWNGAVASVVGLGDAIGVEFKVKGVSVLD